MKVYFSASRFYKGENLKNYESILEVLKGSGLEVMDGSATRLSPLGYKMPDKEKEDLYKSVVKMMDKSDFCVFEASYPSTLHIGHEITLAISKNKPTIVLHTKEREPILFKGMKSDKVTWIEYTAEGLKGSLTKAVENAKRNMDVRFNFFVSPKILNYLDWVAQKRMEPRSVFLRDLIEKEMKKDKEFKS